MKPLSASALVAVVAVLLTGCAGPNRAPTTQGVYFIEPTDGATVSSPFKLSFGLKGMDLRPAGELAAGTGHHHLLVNRESIAAGELIPADNVHLHFGKGQTETEVKLPPGAYKLTLQFADGYHQSYGKAMSATLSVIVK